MRKQKVHGENETSISARNPEVVENDMKKINNFIEENPEFPGFSDYKKCCCCCTIMENDKTCFCGNWKVDLLPCIAVEILVILGLFCHFFFSITRLLTFSIIMGVILVFFFIMTQIVYFRGIFTGPGYIPFYYSLAKNNNQFGSYRDDVHGIEESFAGVISSQAQKSWAEKQGRPPRSCISAKSKRFIIRPDHYCNWLGVFIGKRNHKFFFLFLIYCSIFCILCCASYVICAAVAYNKLSLAEFIILMIAAAIALVFAAWQWNFLYDFYNLASRNSTYWEDWNKIPQSAYDLGDKHKNFEEIFGEGHNCCYNICPISPFADKSNFELIDGLLTYADARRLQ